MVSNEGLHDHCLETFFSNLTFVSGFGDAGSGEEAGHKKKSVRIGKILASFLEPLFFTDLVTMNDNVTISSSVSTEKSMSIGRRK